MSKNKRNKNIIKQKKRAITQKKKKSQKRSRKKKIILSGGSTSDTTTESTIQRDLIESDDELRERLGFFSLLKLSKEAEKLGSAEETIEEFYEKRNYGGFIELIVEHTRDTTLELS